MKQSWVGFAIVAACAAGFVGSRAEGQVTARVSVSSTGLAQDGGVINGVTISGDGRFVAFDSDAWNLGSGPTWGSNIFVHDRESATTQWITRGAQDGASLYPSISSDGRWVAYVSQDSGLVLGDTNGFFDVFVCDLSSGATTRVDVSTSGLQANGDSYVCAISGDGRFVAFDSVASNLVSADTNLATDIFVRDRDVDDDGVFDEPLAVATICVSVDPFGVPGDYPSYGPTISADGSRIAFVSAADNLVPGDTNPFFDIFVRDLRTGTTTRESVDSAGLQANSSSLGAAISGDGLWVAFQSRASNLDPSDANGASDVFLRSRAGGTTVRVSKSYAGGDGDGNSGISSFSPEGMLSVAVSFDGYAVAFASDATNLVVNDTNGVRDLFLYNAFTASVTRASVNSVGEQGDGACMAPAISDMGFLVAFRSDASNLVLDDVNGQVDVFVHDVRSCSYGNVNDAHQYPPAQVLSINGTIGVVDVAVGAPLQVNFAASPSGPNPTLYVLWAWRGYPTYEHSLYFGAASVGCTVNPTPYDPSVRPQPFRCLRGGFSTSACSGVVEVAGGPASAPWTIARGSRFTRPMIVTLQGLLLDAGGYYTTSITNAVILRIRP